MRVGGAGNQKSSFNRRSPITFYFYVPLSWRISLPWRQKIPYYTVPRLICPLDSAPVSLSAPIFLGHTVKKRWYGNFFTSSSLFTLDVTFKFAGNYPNVIFLLYK
jgi:hypothetical protein